MTFETFADAIKELAVVSRQTVYRRIQDGWTKLDALCYPAHCRPGDKFPMVIGQQVPGTFLTLLRREPSRVYKKKVWYGVWTCLCMCGEVTTVLAKNLQAGRTKSCGCLQKSRLGEFNTRTKKGVKRNAK